MVFHQSITQKGSWDLFNQTDESYATVEELDEQTNMEDLPPWVNWNAKLPDNTSVPRVDLHSLILDFSAVSFLDISAVKGLKMVQSH